MYCFTDIALSKRSHMQKHVLYNYIYKNVLNRKKNLCYEHQNGSLWRSWGKVISSRIQRKFLVILYILIWVLATKVWLIYKENWAEYRFHNHKNSLLITHWLKKANSDITSKTTCNIFCFTCWISSVQFSHSVVSNSLWSRESQHTRPPCPSPTPRVHSDSHPLSRWCHPAISSSVVPFSSCPPSLPASESFPMSQLFAWGGQSTGLSALASVLPMNTQGWSPLEWTGWISLQSKGLSRAFSNTTVQKHQFFGTQLSSQSNSHIHTWPLEKP